MAFQKPKKLPQFADLITVLARSKDTDNALYQTIQEIINRLDQFIANAGDLSGGGGGTIQGSTGPPGPPGVTQPLNESFITVNAEATLSNHRRLVAGTNVTLNTANPGQIIVNSSGGVGGGMNLDYLGDYVGGPVYNDGDIVVGPDNIIYICVVDGTVTPPEPWPAGGLATSDATYWTVTPHAGLANERALSSLANGYVKSTVGEPSTVATIPLTDTTGILPDNRLTSNVALKNIDNQFVPQTFASYSNITGPNSSLMFIDTGGGVDAKIWRWISYNDGAIHLESMNDAFSAVIGRISFNRAGVIFGDGSGLTNLNASNLSHGLANPARLGSGTANSSTFLRGDSTWAIPGGVPAGAVLLFNAAACPPGYTRIAGWDGYYVRMGPVVTSGGSNTHGHGVGTYTAPAHTHGAGTLGTASHNHGGQTGTVNVNVNVSGNTSNTGAHTHTWSDSINQNTGGESAGIMGVDAGGSGNMTRGPHTHNISFTVNGTTSNDGNHVHTFSGSGSGSGVGSISNNTGLGITGSTASGGGGIGIVGASDVQFNMPLYVDMLACMKD